LTIPKRDDPKELKDFSALWSTYGAIIPDDRSVEYAKRCIRWAKETGLNHRR
jgi:hypothetical protein